MPKTFAQKVLAKKAGLENVVPSQIVTIKPDHLLTHDNTAPIIAKIGPEIDQYGICDPKLPLIILDHVVPAVNEKTATAHKKTREYVKRFGIENFYDAGEGICHQIVFEKGLALPGTIVLGSDSHTCSYGALNVFSSGIDRTEAASIILTGETWLKVPESIKVNLKGSFKPGVGAKDLVLHIIGDIRTDGANYCAVEFHGAIDELSMEERFTISNMGIEMGAKAAVFPVDDKTKQFLENAGVDASQYEGIWADPDAKYMMELEYDLGEITPKIALPHTVDNVKDLTEVKGTEMDQFFIGTCTNGRLSDLKIAADILKDNHIADGSRLLILPASRTILLQAIEAGYIETFVKAGAMILPPGCGPCLGAHQGALAPGEKCLSTANRNFKGRMGCKDAEVYLASPQTVAYSAIQGKISDPREVQQ